MSDFITFRQREHAPENVFNNGVLIGHVEFVGDGWKSYHRNGEQAGFSEHKSRAARLLAEQLRESVATDE